MARRKHYHVYVIELSKDVLHEGKFKKCNPGYLTGKPCARRGSGCGRLKSRHIVRHAINCQAIPSNPLHRMTGITPTLKRKMAAVAATASMAAGHSTAAAKLLGQNTW